MYNINLGSSNLPGVLDAWARCLKILQICTDCSEDKNSKDAMSPSRTVAFETGAFPKARRERVPLGSALQHCT